MISQAESGACLSGRIVCLLRKGGGGDALFRNAAITKIAARLPVLVAPTRAHAFDETIAFLRVDVKRGVSEQRQHQIRSKLADALPAYSTTIKHLPFAECMFLLRYLRNLAGVCMARTDRLLLSVYYLETLRARSLALKPVFVYLEAHEVAASDIADGVRAIVDEVRVLPIRAWVIVL